MYLHQISDKYYDVADTPTKQRIIGSIFDEKLVFEKNKCRTTLINDVAVQICRKERASKGGEKGKHTFSDVLSCQVGEAMPESNEIIKDLAKIQHVKFLQ